MIIETVPGRVAFQYPNFRFFMTARFLITSATEMQAVAVGWQVYALTHRPLDLGLVGLAQFLPGIFLFLVAGHAADRVPRQRILQTCYAGFLGCSLALLALTLRGIATVWPIYAVLLGNGVVRAFNGPAGQAFLPLAGAGGAFPERRRVELLASFMSATILGPAVGGVLYGLTGNPVPVYALFGGVARWRASCWCRACACRTWSGRARRATAEMVLDGLRYIWRNPLILGAISLDLFAVLLGGAVALLPVYAREILHIGATGLGILRGAPGIGALVMAIAVAHWPLRRHAGAAMLWCVAGFGVFTVVFGLSRSLLALAGGAGAAGRLRHGQRDRAPHHGAAPHSRRNARPRERGQHGLRRRVQRSRPVRIAASPRNGSARSPPWSSAVSAP